MAKHLNELPEHSRFGVLQIKEPKANTEQNVVTIKPEPKCGCKCGKAADSGYSYDGEMFASKDCVIRMMISEGWLKEVS